MYSLLENLFNFPTLSFVLTLCLRLGNYLLSGFFSFKSTVRELLKIVVSPPRFFQGVGNSRDSSYTSCGGLRAAAE